MDQVTYFIVNGSDVLVGKSATKEIRNSMTKSEWFASMNQEQKNQISEIAYEIVREDMETFDIQIVPNCLEQAVDQLKVLAEKDTSAEDTLLRIGDLLDDGNDWLPEGGEN